MRKKLCTFSALYLFLIFLSHLRLLCLNSFNLTKGCLTKSLSLQIMPITIIIISNQTDCSLASWKIQSVFRFVNFFGFATLKNKKFSEDCNQLDSIKLVNNIKWDLILIIKIRTYCDTWKRTHECMVRIDWLIRVIKDKV